MQNKDSTATKSENLGVKILLTILRHRLRVVRNATWEKRS